MKRRIFGLCLLAIGAVVGLQSCDKDDEKNIAVRELPQEAQRFVADYFSDQTVARTRQEKEHGTTTYEVRFVDGTEIEFDAAGQWTHIDRPFGTVPAGIVPEVIATDVAARYPNAGIHEIEKEPGGYEVGITNGLELYYTSDGVFVRAER